MRRGGGGHKLGGAMRVLVVGYGNPIRRDDAVGLWIANRLALKGVETVSGWPFNPELIARIAAADLVFFVDADVRPGPVRWKKLRPKPTYPVLSHDPGPEELLSWAKALFKRAPKAWLVTVPGRDFSFGEGLTLSTRAMAERVVKRIERLLANT